MFEWGARIKEFNLVGTLSLEMKILDYLNYIEENRIYEKDENQQILELLKLWLEQLKSEQDDDISTYYAFSKSLIDVDNKAISNGIIKRNEDFQTLMQDMKYVPIQPPAQILRTMVDEVITKLSDSHKVKGLYYKIIPDYNFTEARIRTPDYDSSVEKDIQKRINEKPIVLSMTMLYQKDPLMWPLILHEYGHALYDSDHLALDRQKIRDEVKVCTHQLNLDIDNAKLHNITSEIFSDLFATNTYGTNYFFAFFFHEILSKKARTLALGKNNKENFKLDPHPPSAIRMQFIMNELEKRGWAVDEGFMHIRDYCKDFFNEISNETKNIPSEYIQIFNKTYETISQIFDNPNYKRDQNDELIDNLYHNIQAGFPISTSYVADERMEDKLLRDGNFDVEINNRIIDMISAGWKFLIIDMLEEFYNNDDPKKYLPNRKLKKGMKFSKPIREKIWKFSDQFQVLLSNVHYSIETSVIVSYYLEDVHVSK